MNENEVLEFLSHHGVKGQKWGVRRDRKTGVRPLAKTLNDSRFGKRAQKNVDTHNRRASARESKKFAKADKKWEQSINSVDTFVKVHNRAADLSNSLDIDRINNQPRFKDRDMNDFNDPVTKAYFRAHETAFNKRIKQAAEEIIGTNPSGTKRINIDLKTGATTLVDVEHADMPVKITAIFDDLHHIVRFEITEDAIAQMDWVAMNYLAHHGVKGQRWGVRRTKAALARAARREGRPERVESDESKRARELGKKKRSELTNEELRFLNERQNLEQTNRRLNPNAVAKGKTKTLATLATIGTVAGFMNGPAGKAATKAGKAVVANLILNKIPVPMK